MIRMKRVYDAPASDDGERVLVDRLWPRGMTKDEARVDSWVKEIGPSSELRKWFGHDPARWDEFRKRYEWELQDPGKQAVLRDLAARSRRGTVTLVFGARDELHNNAMVLKHLIDAIARPAA
jgi:uncharacterized protein YeaO (DUF488 family)